MSDIIPTCYSHTHSIFRKKGDKRLKYNRMFGQRSHFPTSSNSSDDQYPFHPRKCLSYTRPYTTSKWKIAKSWSFSLFLWVPPFRIESLGFRKIATVMMH